MKIKNALRFSKITLFMGFSFFAITTPVSAQTAVASDSAKTATYQFTYQLLQKTSVCIYEGQKWEIVGKIYTNELAKAIQHQQYACKLYAEGNYKDAIIQSYRARVITMGVIRANKGTVNPYFQFTEEEKKWLQNAPDDKTIDDAAQKNSTMISMKDSDYASGGIADIVPEK